jgi:uncharacterized membrane protein HdeD (DUF308 family)
MMFFPSGRYYRLGQGILLVLLGVFILIKPELIFITMALVVSMILIAIGVINIFSSLR